MKWEPGRYGSEQVSRLNGGRREDKKVRRGILQTCPSREFAQPYRMRKLSLLLLFMAALANAGKSELVLDNIGNVGGDSTSLENTRWIAQSFETSAGSWTLDDVVVRVGGTSTNVFVAIYADSGIGSPASAPGGVLETLSGQSSFSTGPVVSNITYTSSGLSLCRQHALLDRGRRGQRIG
ncbi:MAG: hypothetical protein ACO39C_09430 [Chthoniobacterales bacterium]